MNETNTTSRRALPPRQLRALWAGWALVLALTGCSEGPAPAAGPPVEADVEGPEPAADPPPAPPAAQSSPSAVGLSLEIENGKGALLRVKAGQTFFVNQIDIRAAVGAMVDEGVGGLDAAGDFADLKWGGATLADEDFPVLPNPDGTFTRRRFFRGAKWMDGKSSLSVQPVDAQGAPTGPGVSLEAGSDDKVHDKDDFFVRRLRAIQWTNDCRAPRDCADARSYLEEALIELRNAQHPEKTFTVTAATAALRVTWTERPGAWTIPVEAVVAPPYAYGFRIDVEALTPPGPGGAYPPGTTVTFRTTLRDGAGNRLHPEGSLPSYSEVAFGPNPAGIQYHRAFFDPAAVYYRRKHRERTMLAQIIGPAQNVQPIRSIVELSTFLAPGDGAQTIATQERDGVFAQAVFFPRADDLFGGAFDPTHAGWNEPVSDQWAHTIPPDAQPGTYLVTLKGSRSYLGEDTPFSRTIKIQVGTPQPTVAQLDTGGCGSCHNGGGALSKLLHANDDRATCSTCHAPIGFEYEGPVAVRTHFIHSRSGRFDAPLTQCSSCHQTADSIERTSKAACLSCHKSYPASHVQSYGPVESMYVGGGRESFSACGEGCHATHPGSGL